MKRELPDRVIVERGLIALVPTWLHYPEWRRAGRVFSTCGKQFRESDVAPIDAGDAVIPRDALLCARCFIVSGDVVDGLA